MAMSVQGRRRTHVLIIPYPAHGHMLPLLHLAKLLSDHGGLDITIATTPKNLPLLPSSPSLHPLVLPFPNYPSLPPGAENTKDLPPPLSPFPFFIHAVSYLHAPILDWAKSTPTPPHAIICDFFTGWAHKLAEELSIPCITFSPYAALSLSVVHRLWHDMPKREDPADLRFPVSFPSVPNAPSFLWYQLSSLYTGYKEGEPVSEFVRECFLGNFKGAGFVFNSFDDLEGAYLDHVRSVVLNQQARVWAVGPVNNYHPSTAAPGGSPPEHGERHRVMKWLDGCEEGSVVYVCFGSQLELSIAQAEAVAAGLERSEARFIWCVRAGPTEVIPKGLEERVKEKGVVIRGWAPQVEVLGHGSVGAYFTHCGYNSVLEAISGGVVMLTWPMLTDQYMNARLVVEVARVGISVCEGHGAVPDPDKLARAITEVMADDCTEKMRAKELKRKAAEAASAAGGTSYKNLKALLDALNKFKSDKE